MTYVAAPSLRRLSLLSKSRTSEKKKLDSKREFQTNTMTDTHKTMLPVILYTRAIK